jgi:hypothetical protein
VLYGVGARLDEQPELLFRLRAVDEKDLVARIDTALPLTKQAPAAGKVLDADDLSTLFGLDMDPGEGVVVAGHRALAAKRKPVRTNKPAQPEPSGVRLKASVQKSVRPSAATQARNQAVIRRTAVGEAPLQKQVRPEATAEVKAAAKVARKAKATAA